jgi:hypothetical protein
MVVETMNELHPRLALIAYARNTPSTSRPAYQGNALAIEGTPTQPTPPIVATFAQRRVLQDVTTTTNTCSLTMSPGERSILAQSLDVEKSLYERRISRDMTKAYIRR